MGGDGGSLSKYLGFVRPGSHVKRFCIELVV